MTSPEWEAANEDDSDRFPQPSPHGAPVASVDPLQSGSARVARYAEVIDRLELSSPEGGTYSLEDIARRVIALADEERAPLVAEVERLRWWKREASEVILGLQDLGKALDLPLGERITGEAAADAASALVARAEVAEAERARLRQDRDEWKQSTIAANRRFEAAEAKLAKVEALADEWAAMIDSEADIMTTAQRNAWKNSLAELRAALADAPAEQRAEDGA